MVLLSLLLATEMSVFFNSSPELAGLRKRLSLFDDNENAHHQHNWLPFWIGFVLLLNICVTISGILATFTTWNVVSAVSDSNAHCLLRSSLGQYVTTLSPRLVVASLYLFFLWFLLFVTELIVSESGEHFSNNEGYSSTIERIRQFLANHLHLVILWGCFVLGVITLFFSIVVPLSAFGRLVLHTGAMSEKPVLSESLELDLLPRGLHAGLVIRAHHSQRRKTTVTRQYNPQHQRRRNQERGNEENRYDDGPITDGDLKHDNTIEFSNEATTNQNDRVSDTYRGCKADGGGDNNKEMDSFFASKMHETVAESSDIPISTGASKVDNEDDNSVFHFQGQFDTNNAFHEREAEASESVVVVGKSDGRTYADKPKAINTSNKKKLQDYYGGNKNEIRRALLSSRRHRRIPSTDTVSSLFLPPATILNLSMTAKEFHDLIDNAIDTSSLQDGPSSQDQVVPLTNDLSRERNDSWNRNEFEDYDNGYERNTLIADKRSMSEERRARGNDISATSRTESNYCISNSEKPSGIKWNASIGLQSTEFTDVDRNHPRSQQHQRFVTRHHRRVSSSRFLLEEWAQENRVRDLYGAAPPADLPQEIVWDERANDCNTTEFESSHQRTISDNDGSPKIPSSLRGRSVGNWLLSPFSSPSRNRSSNSNNIIRGSIRHSLHRNRGSRDTQTRIQTTVSEMRQPLLPHLTADRGDQQDEEMGGGGESLLLGEGLLQLEGDERIPKT